MSLFINHYQNSIESTYNNKDYFACICVTFPFIEYLLRELILRSTKDLTIKEGNNLYKKSKINCKILTKVSKINPQIFNSRELKRINHLIGEDYAPPISEICEALLKNTIIDDTTSAEIIELFKTRNKILHGNIVGFMTDAVPLKIYQDFDINDSNEIVKLSETHKPIHTSINAIMTGQDKIYYQNILDQTIFPIIKTLEEQYYQTSNLYKSIIKNEGLLDNELKGLSSIVL